MKTGVKKLLGLCCAAALALSLAACSSGSSDESSSETKDTIVIGTSSVSIDLAESGKEALEEMGYTVEITVFDDYVLPNDALVEGSIDANLYQHEPYMTNYNDSNDTEIIMLEPKLYNYYTGIYSVVADSIEDLPDGGNVGIAEDASNISEQLQQIEEAGLITLSDEPSSGDYYTVADIVDNPHGYTFVSSDSNKYKNMDDFTFIIGTSNTMAEAGVDPTENCLMKFVDDDLAEGLCILAENEDEAWVADLLEAYTSDEAKANVPASSGFEPVE